MDKSTDHIFDNSYPGLFTLWCQDVVFDLLEMR